MRGTTVRESPRLRRGTFQPFAIFRSHDERHLRVFCRNRNRLSAEKLHGREFMERKITVRQQVGPGKT